MKFPGITFHHELKDITLEKEVTPEKEVTLKLKATGIQLSIPADDSKPISLEETLSLTVRTCFNGPFELPDDYESASPAYLIKHSKFQNDITVKIHHYVRLESEKDCDDMVFLSASSTPEFREIGPMYVFKEIKGAKGVFKPQCQVGEIKLSHFCLIKAAKRKRNSSQSSASKKRKGKGSYFDTIYY